MILFPSFVDLLHLGMYEIAKDGKNRYLIKCGNSPVQMKAVKGLH